METPCADPADGDIPADDWGGLARLPGNPLMWVLILGELLVFGAVLMAFAVARVLDPAAFHAGHAALDIRFAGANTLVLVTSGYLAARAAHARAQGAMPAFRWQLGGAGVLGLVFLVLKGFEWGREFAAGHGVDGDTFFTLFFLTTGFHAAHVAMGIILLAIVARWNAPENVETATAFWHMVDLIWLLVFPVLYLSR